MKVKPFNIKNVLITLSVISVIIIGIIFISNTYSVKEEKPTDLIITNDKVTKENGTTKISAEVINQTGEEYALKYINVKVISEGNEIILPAYVGDTIKDNTSKKLDVTYDKELEVSSVTYEVKK